MLDGRGASTCHDPHASGNHSPDFLTRVRVMGQRRFFHTLFELEPPNRGVRKIRHRLIDVGRHDWWRYYVSQAAFSKVEHEKIGRSSGSQEHLMGKRANWSATDPESLMRCKRENNQSRGRSLAKPKEMQQEKRQR